MTTHDLTRRQAQLLLAREAALAAAHGRRYEEAIQGGDAVAARRWNDEYRLAAFRCRTVGAFLRTQPPPASRPPASTPHHPSRGRSPAASR